MALRNDAAVLEPISRQGEKWGCWTVLDGFIKTPKGERKWLCHCECGTERYVLERALRSGSSRSCGCLRKKNTSAAVAYDLTGQVFGDLRVIRKADHQPGGGVRWLCSCSCGEHCDVSATLLVTGRKRHCGGSFHEKRYAYSDITGKQFHRLTALYPTLMRDAKGSVIWHCRCQCGREVDVAYNSLMYSRTKSCGCQKKEHDQKLRGFLTHVDGTSIDMLKSKKVPAHNTSGVKGVYFTRGQYAAKIVFQKRQYYLGTYPEFEQAAAARKAAEEQLNRAVLSHYAAWSSAARSDPKWAEENPIRFAVTVDEDKRLRVQCFPQI